MGGWGGDKEVRTGTRHLVKRTFVREKVFEQVYKGKPDWEKRWGEKVQHIINQSEGSVAGRWARGEVNLHLDGHELYEDYEDQTTGTRVVAETSLLGKGDDNAKASLLAAQFTESRSTAQQSMSKVDVSDMMKLCQQLEGRAASAEDADDDDEVVEEEGGSPADDDADSSEEDGNELGRGSSTLFARLRAPLAKAKSSAARKAVAPVPESPRGSPSATANADARVVNMTLDGRTVRLKETLSAAISKVGKEIGETLRQFKEADDPTHILGGSPEYQTTLKGILKDVSASVGAIKTLQRRISQSKSDQALVPEAKELSDYLTVGERFCALLKGLTKKNGVIAQELDELVTEAELAKIAMNKTTLQIVWWARFQGEVQYSHIDEAVSLLKFHSRPATALAEHGRTPEDIYHVARFIFEDFFLRRLGNFSAKDCTLPIAKSPTRQELWGLKFATFRNMGV